MDYFDLKLYKNEKENIACWCEPFVNKLATHPCLYTVLQNSSTILKEVGGSSVGVDNVNEGSFQIRIRFGIMTWLQ
jgi:hypothetical protein